MGQHIPSHCILELFVTDTNKHTLEAVNKALGSATRLEILSFLGAHTCSVLDIAEALGIPQSTATMHINILERAGLIKTDLQPAKRGIRKMCARVFDRIVVHLPAENVQAQMTVQSSMPVGAFVDASVEPSCGLLSETGFIGEPDDPASFFKPERLKAQMLWMRRGFVEYRYPRRAPLQGRLSALELSLELCSEAPLYHDDWPSDITMWINEVELGSWTSPADFGGERGLLTPEWWDSNYSQYGLLKTWRVNGYGSYVDTTRVSSVKITDLSIEDRDTITTRIGVKPDAAHPGGLNLFGRCFGNYPQDIVLKLIYL